MNFEYASTRTFTADIDIETLGNCCIEANDEVGSFYYLFINTSPTGETNVLEYGPIFPDIILLPKTVNIIFNRFNYSEPNIVKTITRFLNDSRKNIFQAQEVDPLEALENFPKLKEFFGGLYE